MKIIIAEDEPLARNRLRRLLQELPDCQLVGEAANGQALLEQVGKMHPDVVLIDIHMPGMDGLNAARRLSEYTPPPAIIFTTAHSEHALSAFGAGACGYLLKPISRPQLQAALTRARQPSRAQLGKAPLQTGDERYIEVRERERRLRVPLSAVIFCQSEEKYTRLVWEGGEHLIETSLRQLEQEFGNSFLRVHRKVLVAPPYIQGLEKHVTGLRLILRGSAHRLPVSRRLAGGVRDLLKTDT